MEAHEQSNFEWADLREINIEWLECKTKALIGQKCSEWGVLKIEGSFIQFSSCLKMAFEIYKHNTLIWQQYHLSTGKWLWYMCFNLHFRRFKTKILRFIWTREEDKGLINLSDICIFHNPLDTLCSVLQMTHVQVPWESLFYKRLTGEGNRAIPELKSSNNEGFLKSWAT